jgi:TetR/AcrR family transcriptional regulator, transcriptional repressor for nem operon
MELNNTRTKLVRTAMQLFWEKGYHATSIADVLHKAKVNSGSLYHFFPGKTDLLAAVLDLYHEGIRQMLLEPPAASLADPSQKIFALLGRYRRSLVESDCFYASPIGSLALELRDPEEPVRARLAKNFRAWIDVIDDCLQQSKRRFPAEVNRREFAQFVLIVMEGGVMQARTFRDVGFFDAAVRQLRHYLACLGSGSPRRRKIRARTPARSVKRRVKS